ncbi:MAG: histidine phosphatase family protein [Bulleidia sp.]
MKKIYLMRHGETLFNLMDINQGQCDSPLTEKGIAQAEAARSWFEDHGIRFREVYCSPLLRACDTAELITDLPLHRNKGLKEIYLGFREASPNSGNPAFPYGDYFVKYGGEDLNAFIDRAVRTITEIAEHAEEDPILIVAHGTVMRCFLSAIDPDHRDPGIPGNCAIAELEYEDGRFRLEQLTVPGRS